MAMAMNDFIVQDENEFKGNLQATANSQKEALIAKVPTPCHPTSATENTNQAAKALVPSSAELERRYFEEKQRQRRLANETSCYRAIHHPDVPGSRSRRKSRDVTVPKEFNLSRSKTPSRQCSESGSDAGSDCQSRRASRERSSQAKGRAWRPELTTPEGPRLRTALRQRSSSRRRDGGAESDDLMSVSVNGWSNSLRGGRPTSRSNSRSSSRASSVNASPARSEVSCRSARDWRPNMSAPSQARYMDAIASTPQQARSASRRRRSVQPSPAGSDISRITGSDMSLASFASRMSGASQRSRSQLSSAQIERLQIEAKRREVKDLMRKNERTYREAIRCPDIHCRHHSLSATVPEEFEFSTRLSSRAASRSKSANPPERESSEWSTSLRRPEGVAPWQPHLTVPQAPTLHTATRSRSQHSVRSDRSVSGRSVSRGRAARDRREEAALARHMQRAQAAQEERAENLAQEKAKSLRADEDFHTDRPAPGCAKEKAERARAAAQARREEAMAASRQHLFVFKGGSGAADAAPSSRGE